MGKSGKGFKKNQQKIHKTGIKTYTAAGVAALLIIGFIIIRFNAKEEITGDLIINKSEISKTASFYPYKAGKTDMEVIAVKASDNTIRTAFNTCQVCYDSGRGYYEQQGDELICQNCGNRFKLDQLERIRGGCNPVPITADNKTEDDESIIISKVFLEESKDLFGNWNKK